MGGVVGPNSSSVLISPNKLVIGHASDDQRAIGTAAILARAKGGRNFDRSASSRIAREALTLTGTERLLGRNLPARDSRDENFRISCSLLYDQEREPTETKKQERTRERRAKAAQKEKGAAQATKRMGKALHNKQVARVLDERQTNQIPSNNGYVQTPAPSMSPPRSPLRPPLGLND